MALTFITHELKSFAENGGQGGSIVIDDIELAALPWAVIRKGGDDQITARFKAGRGQLDVALTLGRGSQEMEDGTVMPEPKLPFGQPQLGNVAMDEAYRPSVLAQAFMQPCQGIAERSTRVRSENLPLPGRPPASIPPCRRR